MKHDSIFIVYVAVVSLALTSCVSGPDQLIRISDGEDSIVTLNANRMLPLFGFSDYEVAMVCIEAWTPEYGVAVRKVYNTDSTGFTHVLYVNGNMRGVTNDTTNVTSEFKLSLDSVLAVEIIDAWNCTVQNARNENDPRVPLDGIDYLFVNTNRTVGSAWNPTGKSPKLISESGELLAQYVLAPDSQRDSIEMQIRETLKELQNECEKEAARREKEK